jgi:hypothetical protein
MSLLSHGCGPDLGRDGVGSGPFGGLLGGVRGPHGHLGHRARLVRLARREQGPAMTRLRTSSELSSAARRAAARPSSARPAASSAVA